MAHDLVLLLEPAVEWVEVDLDAALQGGIIERPGRALGPADVPDLRPPLLRLGRGQQLHADALAREAPPRHDPLRGPHEPDALAVHHDLAVDLAPLSLLARLVAEGVAGEDV